MKSPNIIFVFADQWRAQALGYAGDPNVKTPHLDRLAEESIHFTQAVSGCPVCSPYRASLLTGQRPLTHRLIANDLPLNTRAVGIGQAFAQAGYHTAYIGKWHVNGHGRDAYIPPERRLGFDYWKAQECTHRYNDSAYYSHENTDMHYWNGYDAFAQTHDAQHYLRNQHPHQPFLLFLSWGPPHAPYHTAPTSYQALYNPQTIQLRPNVPEPLHEIAAQTLTGYYAHCSALDHCIGDLQQTLRETGLEENTIFVFTSDHGDMLYSQGQEKKQRPYEESVRVPFLLKYPARFGMQGRECTAPIDAPDIMPTLLSLAGLPIPNTANGRDFSDHLHGGPDPTDGTALIGCYYRFGEWKRSGGREYRAVRTAHHTYARTLDGPWLLYDNQTDPYQLHNLIGQPQHAARQAELETLLQQKLSQSNDAFLSGDELAETFHLHLEDPA